MESPFFIQKYGGWRQKNKKKFAGEKEKVYLCTRNKNRAQMAESVDALVSNTSGATHPGSIPGLGTKKNC